MPFRMRELLEAFRASRRPCRFEPGSIVLSLDEEHRKVLDPGLSQIDAGKDERCQRSFRIPLANTNVGLTLS